MAKILMVQIQPYPYAGVAYLCAAARTHGHSFVLALGSDVARILREIESEKPDCIGFTCMTGIHAEALSIARAIKRQHSIPIVIGGPHPTLFPEMIHEDAVDVLCRGEGEFALVDLLNALERHEPLDSIPNLCVKRGDGSVVVNEPRPLEELLDAVPLIDWTCYAGTVAQKSAPVAFLIRGCPYSCTYCFNAAIRGIYRGRGRYIRHFSVDRAIMEVKQALDFFEPSTVLFSSDTFGVDLAWTEELFRRYSELTDLPFILLLRPELATQEFIDIIRKHRCHAVALGVESGSERVRFEVMNRKYSNALLLGVAERLHAAGIKFRTYSILGLPTETEEEMWETVQINVAMKADYPRASIFTPYPGTAIVELAQRLGCLDESFGFDSVPPSILSHSLLKNVDQGRLINMLHLFQTMVKFPSAIPLLRRMVSLPPNPLFKLWFFIIYVHVHRTSENRRLLPYIPFILANARTKA